ncbi:Osmotically-inducible protein Y precursor [compost metagenome]|jgi:hyperosmotically inducible protein
MLAANENVEEAKDAASDTWITTKVKSTLLAEDATPGMDIEVETKNGVVSLSGTVATEAEKEAAVAKARQIKGVTDVSADGLKVAE